ncbi:toxin ParE1/3/4 [uncultured Thiomicrorhabdus sp.]|jgi:plasmid stabilization system protein ParE
MKTISLTPAAEKDLQAAWQFYERLEQGLGNYCIDALITDLDSLQFYSGIHPQFFGYYRLLAKRFPYAIYYSILDNEVVVSAILATKQNPQKTSKRFD